MSDTGAGAVRQSYRPLLQIAAFCEKVLEEKDGVLSLIRVVNRITVRGSGREMPKLPVNLVLVVSFKSGFMRGKTAIRVKPFTPRGQQLPVIEFPALFEGDDRGVNFVYGLTVMTEEEGLYWFDICVEDEQVTRLPLRVIYLPAPTAGPAQG